MSIEMALEFALHVFGTLAMFGLIIYCECSTEDDVSEKTYTPQRREVNREPTLDFVPYTGDFGTDMAMSIHNQMTAKSRRR